ncbi:MAG: MarR family transcriptional regulator [Synergistaceae bacterium]|nr:MarR family transcriptional regulator [Synergistaceae bacterium]
MASNIPIDYGTGEKYTMVEVHMLKYIIDNPGKTVTDLSFEWDRTKAAISLMLKNMEQKNLIRHQPSQENHKKQLYFATEKGLTLNEAHRKYDDEVFGKTLEFLRETCSEEDIATCFDVLREFINARRRKHYQAK